MGLRDGIVTVYIGGPNQINITAKLGKKLAARSWKNKEQVFAYYDGETDRIIITRSFEEAKKKFADGEIWNRLFIKASGIYPLSPFPAHAPVCRDSVLWGVIGFNDVLARVPS